MKSLDNYPRIIILRQWMLSSEKCCCNEALAINLIKCMPLLGKPALSFHFIIVY
jgi:hypothetical protein